MKVGLTYDLKSEYIALGYSEEETAEFDSEATIAAIDWALRSNGASIERIGNINSLVQAIARGKRWDLVFNIAEGLHGSSREAQIPSLLEAYKIPYTFSDSLILSLTHHKPTTKQLVAQLNIPTPDVYVISSEEDISSCTIPFPAFVKPVAEGTSKGIDETSFVTSMTELTSTACTLLNRFNQAVMVESFLPGRELTVGIVGTGNNARVAGVLEITYQRQDTQQIYSYHAKEFCEQLIDYNLVSDTAAKTAAEMALYLWKKLDCRDAGRVDFRLDAKGTPNFLEVNPLAGLHPTHSDLPIMWQLAGLRYEDLIGEILTSALERTKGNKNLREKVFLSSFNSYQGKMAIRE